MKEKKKNGRKKKNERRKKKKKKRKPSAFFSPSSSSQWSWRLPINGGASLPSPQGISSLHNEILLHIIEQREVEILDFAKFEEVSRRRKKKKEKEKEEEEQEEEGRRRKKERRRRRRRRRKEKKKKEEEEEEKMSILFWLELWLKNVWTWLCLGKPLHEDQSQCHPSWFPTTHS